MHCCDHVTRRRVIEGIVGGATVAATLGGSALAAGQVDALLLTCMDYRLENETVAWMDGRSMRDKYDHVVLAGASLGALTTQRPDWGRTFWQHLDVAIQLHHVHQVIVLDHRDCGAYRVFLGAEAVKTPEAEFTVHAAHLKHLRGQIARKHPRLEVELNLMSLDGSVQTVT